MFTAAISPSSAKGQEIDFKRSLVLRSAQQQKSVVGVCVCARVCLACLTHLTCLHVAIPLISFALRIHSAVVTTLFASYLTTSNRHHSSVTE